MFQDFSAKTRPDQGPPRLHALRALLRTEGLDGYIIPRADAHQGEYVAPHDDRLGWLTGFTGSAGFAIVLAHIAGVFIDGRYRVQVKTQVDPAHFTPVPWPETQPGDWLRDNLTEGVIGYDPWLHSQDEITRIEAALEGSAITLRPVRNLVDAIWPDQPPPPLGRAQIHPLELAGESSAAKRARLAAALKQAGHPVAMLTRPDSIAWLLNIRGTDIPHVPIVHCFALLHDSGHLTLFIAPEKLDAELRTHLGPEVSIRPPAAFGPALHTLPAPVRLERSSTPVWVAQELGDAGIEIAWGADPCLLPKARKNAAEIAGTIQAHLRDGAAMAEFLAWLDAEAPKGGLSEIDVVTALENFRRADPQLRDISFETIAGAGPNGAIVHYRVTGDSNRRVRPGDVLLVDSGGQYPDGTTDITRTVAVGTVDEAARQAFTRVLQGMIAISRARWPRGLAGRDLDALARYPLWLAGQDYDHGTGHGVGVFLSVHEGPQRLSRLSDVALEPDMIVSNEPGYYREGAFGIRIENLIVVREAPALPGGDARAMLCFDTLTWVPIDRRMILPALLSPDERDWLNAYHAGVFERIAPRVSEKTRLWLQEATAPL